jgi:two-component system, sporulation sensor kinase E
MKSLIGDDYTVKIDNITADQYESNSPYLADFLLIVNVSGYIINFSRFSSNSFISSDPAAGENLSDIFEGSICDEFMKRISDTVELNTYIDKEYTVPVGYINRIYHARYIPSADSTIVIMIRDITKLKRAEEALIQTDLRFRSVWENSIDGMRLLDMNGNIVAANKAYSDLTGMKTEEFLGRPFTTVYKSEPVEVKSEAIEQFKKDFSKRTFNKSFDAEAEFQSGKKLFLEVFNVFIESSQENALEGEVLLLSIFRDITERKRSENDLRNSEMRFRSIWENSIDGMRLTDSDGNIVAVNNSFCKLCGFSEEELTGELFTVVYTGKTDEEKVLSLHRYKENFSARNFSLIRHSRSNFRSDNVLDLEVTYSIIEYKEGEALLLAIFHDTTEMRKAEEELRKAETMAVLGRMAAYVSHEIKTPLASIRMNIELITKDPALSSSKQKSLHIIQKEIKRLNNLLKNVLQYSRNQELHLVDIYMPLLIKNVVDLLKLQLMEKNIDLKYYLEDINITGDYQQLQSVFMHLIENSMEAINNGGNIEIYGENNEEDGYKIIYIKDNGPGISDGKRIFEPFYTTKHTGTGLGLAIAQKIILQHNGELSLQSSSPGDTIFAIKFFNNVI